MSADGNVMCHVKRPQSAALVSKGVAALLLTNGVTSGTLFMFSEHHFLSTTKGKYPTLQGASKPRYFTRWHVSIDPEVSNLLLLEIKS